jgi:tetratricopeptide (TPR) repeat protein
MNTIAQKLDLAWRLRFDQRNEESLALWCDIREELKIERRAITAIEIQNFLRDTRAELLIDAVLLQASLCRMQKQFQESNRILSLVSAEYETIGLPLPARYLIESGLNHLVIGDFTNALELFLTASARTKSQFQKLASLMNIISCYGELGVAYDLALKQAQDLLAKVTDETGVSGAKNYLELIKARQAFRSGEFSALFTEPLDFTKVTQTTYLKMWIGALPYHEFQQNSHKQFELFSAGSTHLFHRAFRMRTLQGTLHPDDNQSIKPSEWADRLYLWVWKWITNPEGFAIGRTMTVLARIKSDHSVLQNLTVEDKQLVRNALMWLSLFDRQTHSGLKDILGALKGPETGLSSSSLLGFEDLLIHFLIAVRDRKKNELAVSDYKQALEISPLWDSQVIHLAQLAKVAAGQLSCDQVASELKILATHLAHLSQGLDTNDQCYFNIDVAKGEITDARNDRTLQSEAIAKALHFLYRRDSVSTVEFWDFAVRSDHS